MTGPLSKRDTPLLKRNFAAQKYVTNGVKLLCVMNENKLTLHFEKLVCVASRPGGSPDPRNDTHKHPAVSFTRADAGRVPARSPSSTPDRGRLACRDEQNNSGEKQFVRPPSIYIINRRSGGRFDMQGPVPEQRFEHLLEISKPNRRSGTVHRK